MDIRCEVYKFDLTSDLSCMGGCLHFGISKFACLERKQIYFFDQQSRQMIKL